MNGQNDLKLVLLVQILALIQFHGTESGTFRSQMKRSNIPVFEHLYGELEAPRRLDALHSERLEQRSGFHDWKIKPHRHDKLEQIFTVLEGGGEAILDGKSIKFVAPFVIYVPSLTVHSFNYIADSSGFVLSAFKAEISTCFKNAANLSPLFNQAMTFTHAGNQKHMDTVIEQIINFHEEYRSNQPGRLLALRSQLALILANLSRCISQHGDVMTEPNFPDQQKLATLMAIIEEHYAQNHGTEFYAKAMKMTSPKLRRMTQSILGISAHQLINNRILLEAKRNILYTSMNASQIADMLGFKDPAYFSRFFKKHTRESPSEYRIRAQIMDELQLS